LRSAGLNIAAHYAIDGRLLSPPPNRFTIPTSFTTTPPADVHPSMMSHAMLMMLLMIYAQMQQRQVREARREKRVQACVIKR